MTHLLSAPYAGPAEYVEVSCEQLGCVSPGSAEDPFRHASTEKELHAIAARLNENGGLLPSQLWDAFEVALAKSKGHAAFVDIV